MRIVVGAMLLAGCGRIGFDPGTSTSVDAPPIDVSGDAVPFIESTGLLDTTFGTNGFTVTGATGTNVRPFDVIPRASGGYLAIGIHSNATNSYMAAIGYTAAGVLDTSFGTNGIRDFGPTGNDYAYAIARLGARLVLVGDGDDSAGTNDDVTVSVIDEMGTPDPSFSGDGYARFDLQAMNAEDTSEGVVVLGSDILVCGVMGYDVLNSHVALVRLDSTGAPVPGWGTGGLVIDDYSVSGNDECSDIATVGGRVITVGRTQQQMVVAGYTATGARDTTFATNGFATFGTAFAQAYGVTIADGDIVAVGESNGMGHMVRLAPDGSRRASFGINGELDVANTEVLFAVLPQPNGKLLVAGERNTAGVIARLLPDGSPDPTFAVTGHLELIVGPNLAFHGLMLEPGGRILAVGTSNTVTPRSGVILRLD